jgi:hypothetical protein
LEIIVFSFMDTYLLNSVADAREKMYKFYSIQL